ncbi:SHOCT domain-containing protein [Methanoculleus sp. Wushi-C6]|uniref:SHOCT domain-containing protein n=1 Tax=Methanoculleus caldifontis TaxID=2651577 RepID=A0ABU3X3Y2_9EURY|nr:SHOCT domain-containing protein [Methanoculleus sp. Wushi-C6]MDV2482767.1 SHOCT domain-containing protein [Methanoculleus sp. Wushi-C6]
MRGGRPGLIGTVARTAVIAGTATVTTRAVDRRMREREMKKAAQAQQAAPYEEQVQAPAGTGITQEEKMAQLRELAELKQMGALTEEEFQQEKRKILAQ